MNLFLLLLTFPIDCWYLPIIVQIFTIDPTLFLRTFQAKESLGLYVFHDEASKPPSTQTQLGASLIAGFTATACSLPFDLLKSRMRKFYLVSGYIFIPVVAMSISIHSVHLHPNSKQKYMLKLLLLLLYQLQRMVADIRD